MFEHFSTPEELFSFKLGSALTMEHDSLDMLGDLAEHAQREELRELFEDHARETRQQIENLEKAFALLGESVNDSPSPTTKGLAKEGKSMISKTDDRILDSVLLTGGLETERYEIAVYETLITSAEARGADDVARLLKANLEQEIAASEKIKDAARQIAAQGPLEEGQETGAGSA